jgi:hypothetical protein
MQAAPGDMTSPVAASLGENTANLEVKGKTFYFSFDTTADQWYNFSLTGPEGTTFYLELVNKDTYQTIKGSYAWYYPSFIEYGNLPSQILIKVESFEGGGDFTVTISEIDAQPKLQLMSYSDQLVKDKIYSWEMYIYQDFGFTTGTDRINHEDIVTASWPANGDDIMNNLSDSSTKVEPTVKVNNESITLKQEHDLPYLLEATYYLFSDGSEIGLKEALIAQYAHYGYLDFSETDDEYVMGGNYKSTLGNKTVYIKIDKATGLLNQYSYLKYTSNKLEDDWKQTRIKDPVDTSSTISTNTSTSIPTGTSNGTDTPLSTLWFIVPLLLIPIIERKYRTN